MSFSSIAVSFIVAYSTVSPPILHHATTFSDSGNFLMQIPKTTKKLEQIKQLQSNPPSSPQSQTEESPSQKLTRCLRRIRNSQSRQNSGVNSSQPRINTQLRRRQREVITTSPKPSSLNILNNSRAACQNCYVQYPVLARQRGIEGRVEIAVDTDAQGNVIKARIIRSSGNSILDKETLRQAWNWKLKPASDSRQEVKIATEYIIAGSCRHQDLQERKPS
ncbi:energy transducer TonB [Nostoc sp. TCL26-01]|uniref:energy transducer TonB n=1 Tax=Nostoc sp. TCL26-01 TaxID=2576904 RepID=UPI0015BAAAF0|nr:energy transducer TonB [Nostoc sp. TCL26-01]QLE56602.1 energy transducer TonB [Nostoc sp. TCL26-01]